MVSDVEAQPCAYVPQVNVGGRVCIGVLTMGVVTPIVNRDGNVRRGPSESEEEEESSRIVVGEGSCDETDNEYGKQKTVGSGTTRLAQEHDQAVKKRQ